MTDALPLDPSARRLIDMLSLGRSPASPPLGVAARRERFRTLMRFGAPPPSLQDVADVPFVGPGGTLPVRLFRPSRASPGRAPSLVYFHGGGMVAGSIDTHDPLCRTLAAETGCVIVSVGYRLAPEHKFPAALDDCLAAANSLYRHAEALGLDEERIGIGGDSAGATLAAVLAHRAKEGGAPRFAFQLLLCPILDFAGKTPSRQNFQTPLLDEAILMQDLALYLPEGIDARDSSVSPLRAKAFSGLPRTFLHSAQCDPLCDEAEAYAKRLAAAGIEVRHTLHSGMPHLFYAMGRIIPHASAALRAMGSELRGSFDRPAYAARRSALWSLTMSS